ncbi:hypothetical protein, variant 1 [Aphanomyces astaci]|uniref:Uncharacterized protein n=1 Tax=Aphanomyces astaci TaxID=112090 RepID=W4GYZ3_APHAT|nr:hypothetical protein, variant 1 [Aphanomyces astaci]ETV84133.1 hypothetical protein, variant 1 [Aphanomyces astaci]|eukprot:XP_009825825.1 hypothetical protein, variant 1 [Aphanomyces astaci]
MCRDQQDEITKLKLHISQLENLLHTNDDGDSSTSNDENVSSSNVLPTPTYSERRRAGSITKQQHDHIPGDTNKWRERATAERQSIEMAMDLVVQQKRELRAQTHTLKAEKERWRHEHMTGQSSVILKEMKRILDRNTATLSQNTRQVRSVEERLHARLEKLNQIEHMLCSGRSPLDPHPFSEADSSIESDYSLASLDDSSIGEALHRFHNDLHYDDGCRLRPCVETFPCRDDDDTMEFAFPAFARDVRHVNSRHGEQRFWSHGATPLTASSALPRGGLREQLQCASIYDKQIAKWVHDRRRVQQAAMQHAKYLTSLCHEMHEYSKMYDHPSRTRHVPSDDDNTIMDGFP